MPVISMISMEKAGSFLPTTLTWVMLSTIVQKAMWVFKATQPICPLRGHWSLSAVVYP